MPNIPKMVFVLNRYQNNLKVRYISTEDFPCLIDYWNNMDFDTAFRIGIDRDKIPDYDTFSLLLSEQMKLALPEKNTYILICELDDKAVGHSNIAPIYSGDYSNVHIHIWDSPLRKTNLGEQFLRLALPIYIAKYDLKTINAVIHSHNLAAGKLFQKVGFEFVEEYESQPGDWSFYQKVKKFTLRKEDFLLNSMKIN